MAGLVLTFGNIGFVGLEAVIHDGTLPPSAMLRELLVAAACWASEIRFSDIFLSSFFVGIFFKSISGAFSPSSAGVAAPEAPAEEAVLSMLSAASLRRRLARRSSSALRSIRKESRRPVVKGLKGGTAGFCDIGLPLVTGAGDWFVSE